MDVLKKVNSNPEQCTIEDNRVILQGKEYDGSQLVEFPTKKTKEYNLKSIVFFILNKDKSLKDYMTLCKKNDASPISYVDKTPILEEIQSYKSADIKGFFVDPYAVNDTSFDIPSIQKRDVIVVPSSLISGIHIENAEKLLLDGVFEDRSANPLSPSSKDVEIDGCTYKLTKNTTKLDWSRVLAVFIDESASDECRDMLNHCDKDVLIFSFKDEKFKSVKLEISNGRLKNRENVVKCLLKY